MILRPLPLQPLVLLLERTSIVLDGNPCKWKAFPAMT